MEKQPIYVLKAGKPVEPDFGGGRWGCSTPRRWGAELEAQFNIPQAAADRVAEPLGDQAAG